MFKNIFPSDHVDVHAHVENRQYNWFNDARAYFYPDYTLYFALAAMLYYPLLCLGISVMKKLNPFELRAPLILWNALLSVLSGYGAYHVGMYAVNLNGTLLDAVCNHERLYTSEVAWVLAAFNGTKIFEWVDTMFLILRKKKIIFLHWFHHLLTFLYCWHGTMFSYRADASGMWFAGMNLFVHAVMYGYYALAAMKIRVPFSWLITVLQTTQMVIGCYVLYLTPQCADSWRENWHGNLIAAVMYLIYLILFTQLLLGKVCSNKRKEK